MFVRHVRNVRNCTVLFSRADVCPQVVRQYEERKKYITQLAKDLAAKEARLNSHKEQIEEVRARTGFVSDLCVAAGLPL